MPAANTIAFEATAPGSLMLLGEYAVLHGKHAIVCAVNKRITVTLTPRQDKRIEILSSLHGRFVTELPALQTAESFRFVIGVLQQYHSKLKTGCDLNITTDFSDKMGLGSSAAVTVATLSAVVSWLNINLSPQELTHEARHIIKTIQSVGSGADVAASVHGGIISYLAQPLQIEKFTTFHPITVLYSGYKTTTVSAIQQVNESFAIYPNLFHQMTNVIGECSSQGIQFLRTQDWKNLGKVMNVQQGLMEALGVSTNLLHDMVGNLRQQPGILGAKISGSGLGDCIIGLGKLKDPGIYTNAQHISRGIQFIPVEIATEGVICKQHPVE